jgi:hypothetical protein
MILKRLQEALKDAEITCGNGETQVTLVFGIECFDISTIRVSHISHAEDRAVTNQIFIELKKLVNI